MKGIGDEGGGGEMPDLALMNRVTGYSAGTGGDDQVTCAYRLGLVDVEDICMEIGALDRISGWFRAGIDVAYGQPFVQMKLTGATVIVETVCHIGVLLYLGQSDACAYGMYRSGWDEPCLTGNGRQPAEVVHDAAVDACRAELIGSEG